MRTNNNYKIPETKSERVGSGSLVGCLVVGLGLSLGGSGCVEEEGAGVDEEGVEAAGADEEDAPRDEGEEGEEGDGPAVDAVDGVMAPISQNLGWVAVSDVSISGSTVVVPQHDPNNASWVLNAPNHFEGEKTTLSATIVHDGFLLGDFGWGHLAIVTRGTNLEPSLQLLGLNSWIKTAFFWGETLSQLGTLPKGQPGPELSALIRGRGPTIWAKGSCSNQSQPCIIFENYSRHHFPEKDVLVGPEIPLPIHSGPFQVWVEVYDYDMRVRVSQGGAIKVDKSCSALTGGDHRCGKQVGDGPVGDALFGFIMQPSLNNFASRRVGVQNARVQALKMTQWNNPCPGCIEP
jgi:hypothetical protein